MFWLHGLLVIFLHMAPMTAGAALAVYQEGGVYQTHVPIPHVRPSFSTRHFSSEAARLAYIRSQAAKIAFAKAHACPSTQKHIPSCPGYVIDHIRPLCDGGADAASNMQWQTTVASYKKDIIERSVCACWKAHKTNCNDPWRK